MARLQRMLARHWSQMRLWPPIAALFHYLTTEAGEILTTEDGEPFTTEDSEA